MRSAPPTAVHPGVALLWEAGVELVVVGRGSVVLAPFARNVDRVARTLREHDAQLSIASDSETLDVDPSPAFLRSEGRSSWRTAHVVIEVSFEPRPGLDFGALLLDAPLQRRDDPGPPWACDEHLEAIGLGRRRPA